MIKLNKIYHFKCGGFIVDKFYRINNRFAKQVYFISKDENRSNVLIKKETIDFYKKLVVWNDWTHVYNSLVDRRC